MGVETLKRVIMMMCGNLLTCVCREKVGFHLRPVSLGPINLKYIILLPSPFHRFLFCEKD